MNRPKLRPAAMTIAVAITALGAIPVSAQASQEGDAPPSAVPVAAQAEVTAGQRHLMQAYGIDAGAARERLELEEAVTALAKKLAAENPADFGGVWIEHEPVYKIVVAFKGNDLRAAIREAVVPALRRHIQIKTVRTSRFEREAIQDRIIAALAGAGVTYASYYDHRTDGMVIETGSDVSAGTIRRLIPQDLQSFVIVRRGAVPERTQATGH